MQAVILAAGRGTRMRPLTDSCPKPLIKVAGRAILDRLADALPDVIDEIIFVIGYRGEDIRAHCGEYFAGRRVKYVTQENPVGGTADALRTALPLITGRFLVLNGDDLLDKESLTRVVSNGLAALAFAHDEPQLFGVFLLHDDHTIARIVEKPPEPPSHLVSTGTFLLDERIFPFIETPPPNGEFYLANAVSELAQTEKIHVVESNFWMPIGRPGDILLAETMLSAQQNLSSIGVKTR